LITIKQVGCGLQPSAIYTAVAVCLLSNFAYLHGLLFLSFKTYAQGECFMMRRNSELHSMQSPIHSLEKAMAVELLRVLSL